MKREREIDGTGEEKGEGKREEEGGRYSRYFKIINPVRYPYSAILLHLVESNLNCTMKASMFMLF